VYQSTVRTQSEIPDEGMDGKRESLIATLDNNPTSRRGYTRKPIPTGGNLSSRFLVLGDICIVRVCLRNSTERLRKYLYAWVRGVCNVQTTHAIVSGPFVTC
jgi:hypothetical protein